MSGLVPPFDFHRVFVEPWTVGFPGTLWVVVMGALTASACGLVGGYLLLRRMALLGDAVSHSILPGLVGGFVLFGAGATWAAFAGALAAAMLTVWAIEFLHRSTILKPDSAMTIVFTLMFAAGVAMVSMLEAKGSVHLDAECILFGEIGFTALEPPVVLGGVELAPAPVMRMAAVLLLAAAAVAAFYKELLLTSFDDGFARSLGWRAGWWHHGLMAALAVVVVAAFESVGAVLAVAMLVVPPMFAAELSHRIPVRFALIGFHAAAASLAGYHLSVWLDCSTAGAMVVAGALLYALVLPIQAFRRRPAGNS